MKNSVPWEKVLGGFVTQSNQNFPKGYGHPVMGDVYPSALRFLHIHGTERANRRFRGCDWIKVPYFNICGTVDGRTSALYRGCFDTKPAPQFAFSCRDAACWRMCLLHFGASACFLLQHQRFSCAKVTTAAKVNNAFVVFEKVWTPRASWKGLTISQGSI